MSSSEEKTVPIVRLTAYTSTELIDVTAWTSETIEPNASRDLWSMKDGVISLGSSEKKDGQLMYFRSSSVAFMVEFISPPVMRQRLIFVKAGEPMRFFPLIE